MKVDYSVTCSLGQVRAPEECWYLRLIGPNGVAARRYMGEKEPGTPDQRVAAIEMIAAERARVVDHAAACLQALDRLSVWAHG